MWLEPLVSDRRVHAVAPVEIEGVVLGSDVRLVLGPRLGRRADVSVVLEADGPLPRRGAIHTPPHLVVEVIAPGRANARRDRIDKPTEYAAFGVAHVWLVHPAHQTLEGLRLGEGGKYVRAFAASEGSVAVPGFEGLVLELDGLWAELAQLGTAEATSP